MQSRKEARRRSSREHPESYISDVEKVSRPTSPLRTHRLVVGDSTVDLPVYEIPVKLLWFSIANGRYADRMIRLKANNPKTLIDPRIPKWRNVVQDMLMGRGKFGEQRDNVASERLLADIKRRKQLVPGIVGRDGGVLDGNRRLAVLMDLGLEYYDGVILRREVSEEDKWRIEAGMQLGKQMIHDYSPMNELLKIREGMELFRRLKKSGNDPAPKLTTEQLVAKALYGREAKDVNEMMRRLSLIEEYLDFISKHERFDLIGDRAERFKEVLKIIDEAHDEGYPPKKLGELKAWLFSNVLTMKLDNWELREVRRAVSGRAKRGKPQEKSKRASEHLAKGLPDAFKLKKECKRIAADDNIVKRYETGKGKKQKGVVKVSHELADDIIEIVQDEKRNPDPSRIISDIKDKLKMLKESISNGLEKSVNKRAVEDLREVSVVLFECQQLLKKSG